MGNLFAPPLDISHIANMALKSAYSDNSTDNFCASLALFLPAVQNLKFPFDGKCPSVACLEFLVTHQVEACMEESKWVGCYI